MNTKQLFKIMNIKPIFLLRCAITFSLFMICNKKKKHMRKHVQARIGHVNIMHGPSLLKFNNTLSALTRSFLRYK